MVLSLLNVCAGRRRGVIALLTICTLVSPIVGGAAQAIRAGGTGSALATLTRLAEAYRRVNPEFQLDVVPNLGSSGGVKALLSGKVDLAATSRPLRSGEMDSGARSIAYGRTPFVFATTEPDVTGLSLAEIAAIYEDRMTAWKSGHRIRLILRPANDYDTVILESFSPAIKAAVTKIMTREGMNLALTDQDAVNAIESVPGALGTASLALLISEHRHARALAINGIAPTPANLASGQYPYAKDMYFVVGKDAPASVLKFLEFVTSKGGQQVLAETGHIPPPKR